jgi:hypothetical protein
MTAYRFRRKPDACVVLAVHVEDDTIVEDPNGDALIGGVPGSWFVYVDGGKTIDAVRFAREYEPADEAAASYFATVTKR